MNPAAQLILAIRLECFLDGRCASMPGEHWAYVKTLKRWSIVQAALWPLSLARRGGGGVPSKHKTMIQCCLIVGPPSTTLEQHQTSISFMFAGLVYILVMYNPVHNSHIAFLVYLGTVSNTLNAYRDQRVPVYTIHNVSRRNILINTMETKGSLTSITS